MFCQTLNNFYDCTRISRIKCLKNVMSLNLCIKNKKLHFTKKCLKYVFFIIITYKIIFIELQQFQIWNSGEYFTE